MPAIIYSPSEGDNTMQFVLMLAAILALGVTPAAADPLIWDQGPTRGVPVQSNWINHAEQNFAGIFEPESDATMSRLMLYMPAPSGGDGLSAGLVSDDVYQLRVWADDNGRPGTLLHTFFDPTVIITALGFVNFEGDGPTELFSVEVSAGGLGRGLPHCT